AVGIDGGGNVYVADVENCRIQKFTSAGVFITKWGTSGGGDGQFNREAGVAVDAVGNVYVADNDNHRIQKFSSTGTFISKWGSVGSATGQFINPTGITVDAATSTSRTSTTIESRSSVARAPRRPKGVPASCSSGARRAPATDSSTLPSPRGSTPS